MQKKIIALAVAGLMSGAAFAQSNVTIYGVVDVYGSYNSVDTTVNSQDDSGYSIGSGGLSGSRIGFKGTEDLGNGLKAGFVLEYGLAVDDNEGIGNDLSGNRARQQLLTLSGNWGTVAAGRAQTTAYDWDLTTFSLAGTGFDAKSKLSGHGTLLAGAAGRADNAFAYISPNFSGFTFAYNHARLSENQDGIADTALTNGTTNTPGSCNAAGKDCENDGYANMLSAGYANGPLAINFVWSDVDYGAESTAANFVTEGVEEWGLSGSYNFGVLKLFAAYQNADFTVKSSTVTRDSDNDKWTIGAAIPLGANGNVHVQYAENDIERCGTNNVTSDNCNGEAWSITYTHNLSKRTTAYIGYVDVSNDDNAANRTNSQFKTVDGGDASSFVLGMRHTF